MAVRENSIAARFTDFNPTEFLFQFLFNVVFCLFLFWFNLKRDFDLRNRKKISITILLNLLGYAIFTLLGISLQEVLFDVGNSFDIFQQVYFLRFIFTHVLVAMVVLNIFNQRDRKRKETENSKLKNLYTEAQVQLLKHQLNPHFFFNSMSTLSAIVEENQAQAQQYIKHLSKIFRYILKPSGDLVNLEEELLAANSYAVLMKMRFECGLDVRLNVEETHQEFQILHMSIQPLIENAIKHNRVTSNSPLIIELFIEDEYLVVRNNLQLLKTPEFGTTKTGLSNLSDRCNIIMDKPIEIKKTDHHFSVFVPIKHRKKR